MLKTIACIFIFFPILVFTQVATGNWRMHIANKAIGIARGGNQVFVALETGLLEYDIVEKESTLWTDVNVLSDIEVSSVFYHDESASFFVGYKNGNIDRIQNNTVTNIPAIKLAAVQGDKTVNSFTALGDIVYASTGLGVVLINTVNNEIKDTYYPNSSLEGILSVTFLNDSIFALTKSKVWKSNLSNVTLADPAQWITENKIPNAASDAQYISLFAQNSNLYITRKIDGYGKDTLFRVDNTQLTPAITFTFDTEINSIQLVDDKILMTVYDGVLIINQSFTHEQSFNNFSPYTNTLPISATLLNGNVFVADNNYGLFEFESALLKKIESSGPAKNSFFSLSGTKNKVAVAAGLIHKTEFTYNTSGAYILKTKPGPVLIVIIKVFGTGRMFLIFLHSV